MDKRIGIYLRVSTTGQSTELQRKEIENYLTSRGWLNWTIYEDKFTGTSAARPALKQLLKDAKDQKIDTVICWKMDRFFRSLKDLVTTLQELNDIGVEFISIKDQIDMTTASGRLLTHLLAAFAEFEASLIKERVIAGLVNAKSKGIVLGRPCTIDKDEVLKLRAEGKSLSEIARKLNTTKSGVSKTLSRSSKNNNSSADIKKDKTLVLDTVKLEEKSIKID